MRIVGLLASLILFPAFVCLPVDMASATTLVNINTANATLLDTLPNVGPTLATRIIEYRTVHGPFVHIEDLQKVSGIGSGVTYAEIALLITVGDANTSDTQNTSSTTSSTIASTTQELTTLNSSEDTTTYTPPPSTFSVHIIGSQNALLEVPFHLSARVTTKGGSVDSSAQISWSFGDGSSATGSEVEKIYRYAGTYLAIVTATDGSAAARDDLIVTAKPAAVRIAAISSEGITLANDANERLDLSGWRLIAISGSFRLPEGTALLPNASVLFPYAVMNWQVTFDASLTYPNGIIAARYAPHSYGYDETSPPPAEDVQSVVVAQPFTSQTSFNKVQTVEPIISKQVDIQTHDEAVIAPTAATELAAVGAVLPAEAAPTTGTRISNLFRSPWTLGFLGIMTLAGGAFILL